MKLFIIPGGGDPESEDYKKGFELIETEAIKREFEDMHIFKFPGHFSLTGDQEFLNQKVAASIVEEKLLEREKQHLPYVIFSRSYGCGVAMEVLSKQTLPNLQRIVLWGPTPILGIYKATVFDKDKIEKAKITKGCYVNYETYKSCNPVEIQLLNYNGEHQLYIGAGSLDEHCKPEFLDFLEKYIGKRKKMKYIRIPKLKHEVTEFNEEYINLIFGRQ